MTKEPCKHLEAELPSMDAGLKNSRDAKVFSVPDIDTVSHQAYDMQPSLTTRQITDFIKKLKTYGLMEHEVLVLVERFVYNKTFAEITKDHGFTDPRTTHKVYKQALSKAETGVKYLEDLKQ